ncbi:tripartite tricarboxylate transporter TctB family protein [Pseudonocardia sp. ICBG1293]|uniref:tripartite tricarboxylate transporter TctB family protein n=1 Tax=Pseudonocardia sp. ICBG1293 TaxID=2844382 RepID=UPI001CCE97A1|nr:tripartite tricarboxylate transporter TctB family protein [Pseudonocardia sp. ICBG1293]
MTGPAHQPGTDPGPGVTSAPAPGPEPVDEPGAGPGGGRRGRAVVAAVVLLFALGYLSQAAALSLGTPEQPGPALFPLAVGAFLAVACLATIIEELRSGGRGPVDLPRDDGRTKAVVLVAATVGYVLLLPFLGHLVTTAVFCVGLLRVLSGRSWRWSVLAGAGMGVAVHLLFVTALGVSMPVGVLEI